MRIVVTGGAGFIGSHLTDAFLARGDEVTVLDDLSAGRPARLDAAASVQKASISDAAALRAAVSRAQPDLICHLAAQIDVRVSVTEPAYDAQVNVVGTVNVLEAAREVDARVIFASSGGALQIAWGLSTTTTAAGAKTHSLNSQLWNNAHRQNDGSELGDKGLHVYFFSPRCLASTE